MKGSMAVEFALWTTPNFVQGSICEKLHNEATQYMTIPLAAVPDDVFHRLVEDWVREVYEKANKRRPPTAGG